MQSDLNWRSLPLYGREIWWHDCFTTITVDVLLGGHLLFMAKQFVYITLAIGHNERGFKVYSHVKAHSHRVKAEANTQTFFDVCHLFFYHFYHPQRSCEGYVFTGVCLSKGGVVSQHALQQVSRGVCLVWGMPGLGVCSGGCLVWGRGAWPRGTGIPACTEADPPGEMATAADGMHPTGMHSCCLFFFFQCQCSCRSLTLC